MKKHTLLISACALLISTHAHAEIKVLGLTLKGPSTKENVDRAIAVTQTQDTLLKIKDLNKQILDKEKTIAAMSSKLQQEAQASANQLQSAMDALLKEAQESIKLNIEILQAQKQSKQTEIANIEPLLTKEGNVLYYTKLANTASLGFAQSLVGYAKNWNDVGQKQAEADIANLKREIADIEKKIVNEQASLQDVLKSPEVQQKQQVLGQKLKDAQDALSKVVITVNQVKQQQIFTPFNNNADSLLADLKKYIVAAKCQGITDMSNAKDDALAACKQQYITKIKAARAKVPACSTLPDNATVENLNACKAVL